MARERFPRGHYPMLFAGQLASWARDFSNLAESLREEGDDESDVRQAVLDVESRLLAAVEAFERLACAVR
jgi:hypothetical protein